MGFQSYRWGDLVGPEGQVALVGRVDSSASLQAGWEVWGESMGANPEVQVVGHLVDLEVGHLVDPEVDHLEGQVVDNFHSGWQEVALEEVGRLGWHENLGQNKIPG